MTNQKIAVISENQERMDDVKAILNPYAGEKQWQLTTITDDPDVIIMDVEGKEPDRILRFLEVACVGIKKDQRIIVYSESDDLKLIKRIMRAAHGYVWKEEGSGMLVQAVETVPHCRYFSRIIEKRLVSHLFLDTNIIGEY